MRYFRSMIYLCVGAVAVALFMVQPDHLSAPLEDHCELADGQRLTSVYRYDGEAQVVPPSRPGTPAPTPEGGVYQYYRMPVVKGTVVPETADAAAYHPCVITLINSSLPAPPTAPAVNEIYHVSYSGVPDLERELPYTRPGGQALDWSQYAVTIDGGEWQPAPGFEFTGLKELLEYWQGFAAALILVGVISLAWPW